MVGSADEEDLMPNHVRQKLTIAGAPSAIEAFVVTARGAPPATGDHHRGGMEIKPLCFHMIAPLPDAFSRKPYGHDGHVGYGLEVRCWSVKWGPYDIAGEAAIFAGGTRATYEFTCAYWPPVRALRRASLRYPDVRMYLSWGGQGPCRGRHIFCAGRVKITPE